MAKKLLKMLRQVSKDLKEVELCSEEVVEHFLSEGPDLYEIGAELAALEASERLAEEELDILRSLVVYILLRANTFDREDIYSLIFGDGRRILWN